MVAWTPGTREAEWKDLSLRSVWAKELAKLLLKKASQVWQILPVIPAKQGQR
jgi:hypothetical protein